MQSFQKVRYDMGDWIECHCKQWTVSFMYLLNLLSVQNLYNSVFVVLLTHCTIKFYDLIYIYDLTQAVANEEIKVIWHALILISSI